MEDARFMGAIAAAVNKQGEDAVAAVIEMLKQLKHRGADSISLAIPTSTLESPSFNQIEGKKLISSIAAGQNRSLNLARKNRSSDIMKTRGCQLLFEGQLFPSTQNFDGSYVFAQVFCDKIIVGRDIFGTTPLYYGENPTFYAVASERKALWKLGIKDVHSFPPGNSASMSEKGFTFKVHTRALKSTSQRRIRFEKAASNLQKLLLESTKERLINVSEVSVAFSGGLDSTVTATLAQKCVPKVNLVTVSLENQPELQPAKKAAEILGLPFHLKTYRIEEVERDLEKVLWLIEEPNVMKASVAIPFFWAAENTSKIGCKVLLAGQGADELFGGYHRYLSQYRREGIEAVQQSMFNDLMRSYEVNFQRDEPVCAYHGVELRLPYIDYEVARFALSLPLDQKIDSSTDVLRKKVLRQVAKNLGLPDSLVNRPKKAIQYATGVDKALRGLARKKDLTEQDYIKQVFEKVYPNWKDKA
jgi:asparagine synthase (glutamine-hydrolysing)